MTLCLNICIIGRQSVLGSNGQNPQELNTAMIYTDNANNDMWLSRVIDDHSKETVPKR